MNEKRQGSLRKWVNPEVSLLFWTQFRWKFNDLGIYPWLTHDQGFLTIKKSKSSPLFLKIIIQIIFCITAAWSTKGNVPESYRRNNRLFAWFPPVWVNCKKDVNGLIEIHNVHLFMLSEDVKVIKVIKNKSSRTVLFIL